MNGHRLTLVPWTDTTPYTAPNGVQLHPSPEQRWTAACDCGWWATMPETTPASVLEMYAAHFDIQATDCDHEPLSFSAVNALLLSFAKRNEHGLIDWPGARPMAEAIVAKFVGPETLSVGGNGSPTSPYVVEAARKTTTPENYIPSTKDTRRCRCGGRAGSNGSCGPSGCLNVPA